MNYNDSIINNSNEKNIIGYDHIESNLWNNFQNNKLHHCNLILAPQGNGKALFAKYFSQKIINNNQNLTLNKDFDPDLLIIEGNYDKNNVTKKILVDDIRKITNFTNLSSSKSENRVIIIDAVDDMNINASNALLKTIEEPANNIFIFLICHNYSLLSDTIKSRCNIIKLNQFNFNDWSRIIKKKLPDISKQNLNNLYMISPESISSAINLYENDWIKIYKDLIILLSCKKEFEIINFCERIADENLNIDILYQIICFLLIRKIKLSLLDSSDYLFDQEYLINNGNFSIDKLFLTQDKISKLISELKSLNLDKKLSILNVISVMKSNLM